MLSYTYNLYTNNIRGTCQFFLKKSYHTQTGIGWQLQQKPKSRDGENTPFEGVLENSRLFDDRVGRRTT